MLIFRVPDTPPSIWSASWLAWCQIPPPSSTTSCEGWSPPSHTKAWASKALYVLLAPSGPKCERVLQGTWWCLCEDFMISSLVSRASLQRPRKKRQKAPATTVTGSVEWQVGHILDWTLWWKLSESLLFIDDSRAFSSVDHVISWEICWWNEVVQLIVYERIGLNEIFPYFR